MFQPNDMDWLNGYKNKTHFTSRDTDRMKVRRWKKVFYANGNQKKAGVGILISDKTDLKIKTVTRDKEGHYIIINQSKKKTKQNNKNPQSFPSDFLSSALSVNSVTVNYASSSILIQIFHTLL